MDRKAVIEKVRQLQKEFSGIQHTHYRYRSTPVTNLGKSKVSEMLSKHNFFCTDAYGYEWANPAGTGIHHDYQLLEGGEIVLDNNTGLMWQRGGSATDMTYAEAKKYIERLNRGYFWGMGKFSEHTDWRLPTLEEAMTLMSAEITASGHTDALFDAGQDIIFTCDEDLFRRCVWIVSFSGGYCEMRSYHTYVKVRAVRQCN